MRRNNKCFECKLKQPNNVLLPPPRRWCSCFGLSVVWLVCRSQSVSQSIDRSLHSPIVQLYK